MTDADVERFVGTIGQVVQTKGGMRIRHDAVWEHFADADGKEITSIEDDDEYVTLENYAPEVSGK